jgi:Carboxypeptidase regulatory-like domain/Putative binding domain, N-terminal
VVSRRRLRIVCQTLAIVELGAFVACSRSPAGPTSPTTYALGGVISDESTRRPIAGARLEVLGGGVNAGKFASTDANGEYRIEDLRADAFTLRVSAAGYNPGEQAVTVPATPRADFMLKPACSYTVSPTTQVVPGGGGRFPLAITRTTGTCGWQAGASADWIVLSSNSGSGTDAPTFLIRPTTELTRTASITIAWSGGSAAVAIVQEANCGYILSPTEQSNVLPSGETRRSAIDPTGDSGCIWHATANVDWIIPNPASGSGNNDYLFYRVAANPSGTPRTGNAIVSWPTGNATGPTNYTSVTVTQLGACAYSASPGPTIDVPAAGGQFTVRLTRTLGSCLWRVWYDPLFLSVPAVSGGDGDTFTFTLDRNSAGTVLTYNIYISLGFYIGINGGFREDHVLTIPVRQPAS